MSSFNPSPFPPSAHTPLLGGLHQTPLVDFIPNSPDTEEFLQVSHHLSTSPAPSMQASTSFTSSAEQASARSETENVRARAASTSSRPTARPVQKPGNTPPSHVHTQPQPQSSPLEHSDPQFSVTSTTDSQGPSPFTHQDHISPEEVYGVYDVHRTESFEEDFMNFNFMSNLVIDQGLHPSVTRDARPVSPSVSDEHINQPDPWSVPYSLQMEPSTTYLLSPVHTSTGAPSPAFKRDNGESKQQSSDIPTPLLGSHTATLRQETAIPIPIPGQSSLQTPEMSQGSRNSSGDRLVAYSTQAAMPQSSPVVKVEDCGYEDIINPEPDQPWETNRLSPAHLSPPSHSVEYSQDDVNARSLSPPMAEVTRAEDGSWIPSQVTGQGGVDPALREPMNDIYVPTLKEQEEQRQLEERKAHVEHWLAESVNPGVPADQPDSIPRLNVRSAAFSSGGGRPRARSTGDMRGPSSDPLRIRIDDTVVDDSGIPGPGVLLDVRSDYEEEDDEMVHTETNTDDVVDTTPPAPPHVGEVNEEAPTDYFRHAPEAEPDPSQFICVRPWMDPPSNNEPTETHMQPLSSNAAIMLFRQRANSIENASRVATWGTRRMSDTDVEKFREPSPFKRLSFGKEKDKHKATDDKKSLLEVTRFLKRKNSVKSVWEQGNDLMDKSRRDTVPTLLLSRSPSSSSKLSKPLKINTGATIAAATAGQVAALGGSGSFGAKPLHSPPSPWEQAKNAIRRRSRSKSDLTRKSDSIEGNASTLSALMVKVGGPPVATLASPPREPEVNKPTPVDDDDEDENDEDDLMEGGGVEMDLTVRSGPIIPTLEGFRAQVKQLNPRLEPVLVERVSQEQLRRYRRLVDCKVKHHRAVQASKCSSGRYCFALGGEAKILPSKASQRDLGISSSEYRLATAVPSVEGADRLGDGSVASAQFPRGVPLPPVKRLPAEFECPLCFKVKKFQKPSDWTKHVHEDVEPFTCTFPTCTEPKSFKRKADWVRHENERHRQLEWWTCNLPDCNHTCYRKDNFVQHLVREHKKPEPKLKTTKSGMKGSAASKGVVGNGSVGVGEDGKLGSSPRFDPNQDEINKVWALVEACRHQTQKVPREEPCKFCGNVCSSWKKLTVHLAKHMQQISLPVLGLVEQYKAGESSGMSPMGLGLSAPTGGRWVGSMSGCKMEPGVNTSSAMPPPTLVSNGAGGLGYGFQVSTAPSVSGTTTQPMAPYSMTNSQYTTSTPVHRASYPGQNYTSPAYPRQSPLAQPTSFTPDQMYVRQPNSIPQAVFTSPQGVSAYPSSNGMTSTISGTTYGPSFNSQQQYVNSTSPSNNDNGYLFMSGPSGGNFSTGSNGRSYGNVNGTGYEGGTYMSNTNQSTHYPY